MRDYETNDVEGAAQFERIHSLPPEPEVEPPPRHELEELEETLRRARARRLLSSLYGKGVA